MQSENPKWLWSKIPVPSLNRPPFGFFYSPYERFL
jgi:hypothetical protein